MQENIRGQIEAEVLGVVMFAPNDLGKYFVEHLDPSRFTSWRMTLAVVLNEMIQDDKIVEPTAVAEHIRTTGQSKRVTAAQVFEAYQSATHVLDGRGAIGRLARIQLGEQVHALGEQISNFAETSDVSATIEYAQVELERLSKSAASSVNAEVPNLYEFLNAGSTDIEWTIPGILPERTSLMITAEEGLGKSVLLRQLAVSAALGIDPFVPEDKQAQYEPKRVLIVDAEVSVNQLRRSLTKVWAHGIRHVEDHTTRGGHIGVISQQAGLDLSRPEDQRELHSWVRAHRPDLLVIGPVYRLTATDQNEEQGVRSWQRPLEAIMASGCSVVLEHHTPNEGPTKRMLRPIGSSAIRRWSAQGIGLRAIPCEAHGNGWCPACGRRSNVELWRGSRDETDWPTNLRSSAGSVWWERDYYGELDN